MPSPQIAQVGILELVLEAGFAAKMVLLLLMAVSVYCWAIILMKWRILRHAMTENTKFLNLFWHGKGIEEVFSKSEKFTRSPVAAVFRSGYREMKKGSEDNVDNVARALMRASNSEVASLERHIAWLATTASAAPFVGLFGTVWGIMVSFQNIGATGAANLAVVAPGISEALVATAAGIGAAIPAVVGYNYFVGQIKRLAIDMDCFSQDFLNIIQRSWSKRGD